MAEVWNKMSLSEVIHSASKGVIFHTTAQRHKSDQYLGSTGLVTNIPAPVVPPARFEDSKVGDCWMSRAWPLSVISREEAFASTKPRF